MPQAKFISGFFEASGKIFGLSITSSRPRAATCCYGAIERRGIDALIPAKAEPIRSRVPLRRCTTRSTTSCGALESAFCAPLGP
jgi:hypothetical protein